MLIPFYITTFQSPSLLVSLINSLDDLVYSGRYTFIISDQSDDYFSAIYKRFCEQRGFTYLRHPNKGATQSKMSVLDHALASGAEFCMQVSEDFVRNYEDNVVVSGSDSFDTDSLTILKLHPEISICKWNILTGLDGDMSYLYTHPLGVQRYTVHKDVKLPYLTGDVVYSNWGATWRVAGIQAIREKAKTWVPVDDFHKRRNDESAGEWGMSMGMGSKNQGACLVARPFIHPARVKSVDSMP